MALTSGGYPIIVSLCLSLFGTTVLTWCFGMALRIFFNELAERARSIESWKKLSYSQWRTVLLVNFIYSVILLVYLDSYLFIVAVAILQIGIGLDTIAPCA